METFWPQAQESRKHGPVGEFLLPPLAGTLLLHQLPQGPCHKAANKGQGGGRGGAGPACWWSRGQQREGEFGSRECGGGTLHMLAPHCLSLAMNNSKRTRPHHEPRAALGLQSSSASPVETPTTPHAVETRRPRMSSSTTTGREPALTEGPPAGRFLTGKTTAGGSAGPSPERGRAQTLPQCGGHIP